MKHIVPFYLLLGMLPLRASAQLSNGGLFANFGVDADTRTNWVKYGPVTGAISSDDWWAPSGTGNNVIDTSNAATYLGLLQTGKNISFNKRMSALLYAKLGGTLWLDAAYGRDFQAASALKDSTTFTIASKNGDNPANWQGGVSSFPTKNDLVDVYAHMRRNGINVHDSLWLFTAVSTFGTTGSSYFDIELYKNSFSYNSTTGVFSTAGPDAGHTQWLFDAAGNIIQTGDMIIAVNFSPGLVPVVDIRIWVSQTTLSTITPAYFNFTGSFDGASSSPTYGYASIVSKTGSTAWGAGISNYSATASQDTTYATPWGTGAPIGAVMWFSQYRSQQFIETGLNLTRMGVDPALYSTLSPCQSLFSNIFFKSRSSTSFTSNMQDFVTPLTFLRSPVMDYTLQPDTIRCNHRTANITLTNNTTAGYYTWQTVSGSIAGSNGDSSQLSITQPGTYIVSASPAQGCPTARTDTVVIPVDTFPPVASAYVGLSGKQLALYGGDPVASNYSTPFGGSAGLDYNWTGPNSFSSNLQDPITDTDWGTYQLTVTERRNGCIATASTYADASMFTSLLTNGLLLSGTYLAPSVNLHWEDGNESAAGSYAIQRLDANKVFQSLGVLSPGDNSCLCFTDAHPLPGNNIYRIKAARVTGEEYYSPEIAVTAAADGSGKIYLTGNDASGMSLVANTTSADKATLVLYDIAGHTLQKRNVYFQAGSNVIPLPAATGGQKKIQVIVLFIDGRIRFSQKVLL
jgi:hypothetical protein